MAGLKNLVIQADKKLINEVLFDLVKYKLTNGKLKFVKAIFSRLNLERLSERG